MAIEKVHAIPHFHSDLEWWKTEANYAKDCLSIGRAVADMLDAEPSFTYVLDQAYSVIPLQKGDPAAFARLRAHAERGRVEPVGATMAAPDHNLPTGEALVRNFLLGKKWWTDNLGRTPRVGWGLDTFGHPAQLPQIMAKCGLTGYAFSRGPDALSGGEPCVFQWVSPDGTRIASFWFVAMYGGFLPIFPRLKWNLKYHVRELRARLEYEGARCASHAIMMPMGFDFMKPSRTWPPFVAHWNARTLGPHVSFSTPSAFFGEIEARGDALPVRKTEMNPLNAGGYESRHKIKQAARRLERRAMDWERLAAAAHLAGEEYPAREIRETWHQLVKNDFHDTINGTPIDPAMREAFARADAAEKVINTGIDNALSALSARIDTRGGEACLLAFNPLPWPREELIEIPAGKIPLADESLAPEHQASENGLLVRVKIPGLGAQKIPLAAAEIKAPVQAASDQEITVFDDGTLRVKFDSMGLQTIRDLRTDRELLDPNGSRPANLRIVHDFGNLWTVAETGEEEVGEAQGRTMILESGPLRTVVRRRAKFPSAEAQTTYALIHGQGYIDVETRVRFTGRDRRVLASFKLNFDGGLVCETLYHATARGPGHWPCQGWAGVFGEGAGLAAINAGIPSVVSTGRDFSLGLMRSVSVCPDGFGKFFRRNLGAIWKAAWQGFRLTWRGLNLIELALRQYHWVILREYASEGAPDHPGLLTPWDLIGIWRRRARPSDAWDRGDHVFRYRLMPVAGVPVYAALTRMARQFESPVILRADPAHEGAPASPAEILRIEGDAVCEVVKRAEDSGDLAIRAYDASGAGARLVVKPGFRIKKALRVALTEDEIFREEIVSGGRLEAVLSPWEIATFVLQRE